MNHKHLIIIGAGGHGRVARDIAIKMGYSKVCFLDDGDSCSVPPIGKVSEYIRYIDSTDFFIAIGNNRIRERLFLELQSNGAVLTTLIHPNAVIDPSVVLGAGTVVMAGAVINADAVIGAGCIINTASSVDHDNIIDDFVHISVGSHLAGNVHVGRGTMVGAGATVSNTVNICENCMIGAGAVVINNIEKPGTYIGVPAMKSK